MDGEAIWWSPVLPSVSLALLLYLVLSLLGLSLSLLDLSQGLGINIDVESNDSLLFFIIFINFLSLGGVINDEILTILLSSQVNSANVCVIVLDVENVNLDNVFVDQSEVLQELIFKLLLSQVSWLAQAWSEEGKIGVIFLIVEEKNSLGLSSVHQIIPHLLELIHRLLHVSIFNECSNAHSLTNLLIGFFLLDNNSQASFRGSIELLQKFLCLGLSFLLDH